MTQHFDAGDDAVLAKRKPAYAVVTGGAQRSCALAALYGGRVFCVISAVHWSLI